mmetsp:Transcript_13050/g.55127  ORF Transcript_13050/g.55127 Transcript_13050/m.55127 type:complete len:448 (+) Transcript_13050:274-1617(+)
MADGVQLDHRGTGRLGVVSGVLVLWLGGFQWLGARVRRDVAGELPVRRRARRGVLQTLSVLAGAQLRDALGVRLLRLGLASAVGGVPLRKRLVEIILASGVHGPLRRLWVRGVGRELPPHVARYVAVGLHVERAPRVVELDLQDEVLAVLRGFKGHGGDGEHRVRVPRVKLDTAKVALVTAAQVLRLLVLPPVLRVRDRHPEPGGQVRFEVQREHDPGLDRHPNATDEMRVVGAVLAVEPRGIADGLIVEGRERDVAQRAEPPRAARHRRERLRVGHDGVPVLVGFEGFRGRRARDEVRRLAGAVVVHHREARERGHGGVRNLQRRGDRRGLLHPEQPSEPDVPVARGHLRVGTLRQRRRGELFLLEHLRGVVEVERALRPDVRGEVVARVDGELQYVSTARKTNRRALRGVRGEREDGSLRRARLVPVVVVQHGFARRRVHLVLGG